MANGTELNCVIVVVLESPHKDEFELDGWPKGPAMGTTGKFFIRNNRDNIWLSVFIKDGGETDLRNRLSALKPKSVINLCTKEVKNLQL